ncbi:MAG: hypothetical protein AABZ47_15575 [Planctomycetota bacterium]
MGSDHDNGVNPSDSSFSGELQTPEQPSRRDVIRRGGKLVFVAPLLSTLFAKQAYAAHYSCYNVGHACPGVEPCCSGNCLAGVCAP